MKSAPILLCLLANVSSLIAQETPDVASTIAYVRQCRKPSGAFGPIDQEYTDAAWNYPAVRSLQLLEQPLDNSAAIVRHGLGSPRGHVGYGHWQFFHQHAIRQAIGVPITAKQRAVTLRHQGDTVRYYGSPFGVDGDFFFQAGGDGASADPRDAEAESLGFYNLSSLYYLLAGLNASRREAANRDELIAFIVRRQTPSGGFADVRTAEGSPLDADSHVAHTFHAVAALRLLNHAVPRPQQVAAFLRGCRSNDGAFRFHPQESLSGNRGDIYYAWAALRTLDSVGAKLDDRSTGETVEWIRSLRNADGGYGDQPGWRSRLYSTYYALDSLRLLVGDARRGCFAARRVVNEQKPPLFTADLKIHQALFKMPSCQPEDLRGLSERGFGLIGLKSHKFDEATKLQAAAREQRLPIEIVLTPEAYPHRAVQAGGAELNHVGNFTLDPRWPAEHRALWETTNQAGQQRPTWDEYRRQVIAPLRTHSLIYPEQDFEMEFAYRAYDAGVFGHDSYNALLVGFNWSPRDFVRVFPWRERYVDKLTPIADCDAHGDLKKWSPQLDHTRHLFVAPTNSYSDFLAAAAEGRVVCVIAQPEGVPSGASFYGRANAIEFVRARQRQWQWW